jgi:tryptophanyl-tRNA synthetase
MTKRIILTGVKPTGIPHIGNYVGALKPALELAARSDCEALYFIPNYHSLISIQQKHSSLRRLSYEVAATWLALGLDPSKVTFYRQSDIPEVLEFFWILSCFTAKGLMNRAHAYKAVVQANEVHHNPDIDAGVNMGLYNYPILMAADILLFNTDEVPVGKDQLQHIEMARDIAMRFNHCYGEVLKLPKAWIQPETAVLTGIDGRKMSKSYDNTLLIFGEPAVLKKRIFQIKTDSSSPTDPKDPDTSLLFQLYQQFADADAVSHLRQQYAKGIGWGTVKEMLFECLQTTFAEPYERYQALMADTANLEAILQQGAAKARQRAQVTLTQVREAIGI